MANKYRLSSKAYDREMPHDQISPKKIYFISVEGVSTEVEYLQGLSDYRTELGINTLVNIEVLRRKTKDGFYSLLLRSKQLSLLYYKSVF